MHFRSRQRQVEFEYEHKPVQKLVNNMIEVVSSVLRTDISADQVLIQSWEQYLCAMSTESRYGVLRSRGDIEIPHPFDWHVGWAASCWKKNWEWSLRNEKSLVWHSM